MDIKKVYQNCETYFSTTLWQMDTLGLSRAKRCLVTCARLVYKLQDDFQKGVFTTPASSLAYITLLSFVPLIALSFALAKAFGMHNMLAPMLLSFLEPIGPKSTEITTIIIGYVDNINVRVLGAVGLAFLIYTAINTIQQIENAFNRLWQIHKPRSFQQKFRDYLSVLLVAPLLMVSSIGITTTIMSNTIMLKLQQIEPFGTVILYLGKLVPYLLMITAFTMIYYLLPNTKVKFRSALAGGILAGVLWETISWAFAKFLVSTAHYSAIYSGFALALVFMIWLYFNWLVMLIGVKVSYHHQFPATLCMKKDQEIFAERFQYKLALAVIYLIGLHHYRGSGRWTLNSIVAYLGLPVAPVTGVLEALEEKNIILLIKDDMTYIPARDMETISIQDLFMALEKHLHGSDTFSRLECVNPAINDMLSKMDEGAMKSLEGETIKNLILSPGAVACKLNKGNSIPKD
jgi:membrane protein